VELKSKEMDTLFATGDDLGKVLIENDGKDGRGKGRVRKIVHGPAKDLALLDKHMKE
jgi:hypothetical protein